MANVVGTAPNGEKVRDTDSAVVKTAALTPPPKPKPIKPKPKPPMVSTRTPKATG